VNALARKTTEETLNSALIQAKSSDNLKSAFLAGISHEIRTPMNHILGFIELLAESDITESEKTEFIGIMKKSGMDLLHLIDDVIELAMIDSGQVDIRKDPCELNRFMESLMVEAEGLKSTLRRSDVQIKLNADNTLRNQIILTDEFRLRQILNNMISNALKYTLEGMVEIGFLLVDDNKIEFYVSDTGIGIQKEEQEVIFERFRRLENGLSRSFTGVGLGLSISQGLASLFKSKITLDSQPGKGSSFRFSIPFLAYEAPQVMLSKVIDGSPIFDWTGKTALMVEDDPVNMRFLTVLLLKTNINLLYASDGKEAVEIAKTSSVDVVLMDMNLPVMDGYEATRQIKIFKPQLPIIAQTAHAMNEDRSNCLNAGCDEYMAKPIDKYRLYGLIEQFLSRKEA
jgi:CheY-like chemotaxis protein